METADGGRYIPIYIGENFPFEIGSIPSNLRD